MSLKAWKFFKVFLTEYDCSGGSLPDAFNCFIPVPTASDFTVYIKPLESTSVFDFVAHLRICGTNQIHSHDLIHLTRLKNLGILEIMEPSSQQLPFPRINDRLIKTWSEQTDPFPSLKILRILSLWLTSQSLTYVSNFSQLCLFEATGPYRDWHSGRTLATELGWFYCDPQEAYVAHNERNDNLKLGRAWNFPSGDTMLLPLTGYIETCRQKFGNGGSLGRLNWIYWLYDGMLRTPLRIDERQTRQLLANLTAEETYNTMELERPIATLSLGKDAVTHEPMANISGRHPYHKKAYLWRYWIPDGETTLNSTTEVALGPRVGFTRHPLPRPPKATTPKRPTRDVTASRVKRRRAEAVDHLHDLLGDSGRGV